LEVRIVVKLDGFEKRYSLDMLVRQAAPFEWKAVESLGAKHRAQLLHYLLLCDLPKGKLVNARPELIEHEFINTTLRREDLSQFEVDDCQFSALNPMDRDWKDFLLAALRDWGAGLDLHLYEGAISHACGGEEKVIREIDIVVEGIRVGGQKARVTSSNAAFKVTMLPNNLIGFEDHARRFVAHTNLKAIHWVNITRSLISFKTLLRQET
jgi:hypothetical protein